MLSTEKIAIQWISVNKTNQAIRWIVIYPVDSAIRLSTNLGLLQNIQGSHLASFELPFVLF